MGNLGVTIFWGENMNAKADSYAKEYIMLCSQLCKKAEDYTKIKVRKHNKAIDKLNQIREEMSKDQELTEEVYRILLGCEDSYVQKSAASDCLRLNIHVHTKIALKIIKKTIRHGDRMAAMGATRTLKIWKGKLDPNDPF